MFPTLSLSSPPCSLAAQLPVFLVRLCFDLAGRVICSICYLLLAASFLLSLRLQVNRWVETYSTRLYRHTQ